MLAVHHRVTPSKFTQATCNLFRYHLCCHFKAINAGGTNLSLCSAWKTNKGTGSQESILISTQEDDFGYDSVTDIFNDTDEVDENGNEVDESKSKSSKQVAVASKQVGVASKKDGVASKQDGVASKKDDMDDDDDDDKSVTTFEDQDDQSYEEEEEEFAKKKKSKDKKINNKSKLPASGKPVKKNGKLVRIEKN